MKSPVVKRSIVITGHKTSVSLEDAFWGGLKDIAASRNMTLSELVASIDADRRQGNLSSAIRLFVLDHYRALASGGAKTETRESGGRDRRCQRCTPNNVSSAERGWRRVLRGRVRSAPARADFAAPGAGPILSGGGNAGRLLGGGRRNARRTRGAKRGRRCGGRWRRLFHDLRCRQCCRSRAGDGSRLRVAPFRFALVLRLAPFGLAPLRVAAFGVSRRSASIASICFA